MFTPCKPKGVNFNGKSSYDLNKVTLWFKLWFSRELSDISRRIRIPNIVIVGSDVPSNRVRRALLVWVLQMINRVKFYVIELLGNIANIREFPPMLSPGDARSCSVVFGAHSPK